MSGVVLARPRVLLIGVLAALALSACGGGGDSAVAEPPKPQPTAIPETMSITPPASADVSGAVSFTSSVATLGGLKYSWDFGDGTTASAEAAPGHSYAKAGEYDVVLRVSNEAGTSRETKLKVTVNNMSHVKGLVCSGEKEAGWCWQQPRPTGSERNGSYFLDAKTGWIFGGNGEIFKTTDAGTSWARQRSGVEASIRNVTFVDANTGWAMADYGALLRTTDGGSTWRVGKIDTSSGYVTNSLMAIDAQTLLIRDGSGTARISSDAGQTWRASVIAPGHILKDKAMLAFTGGMLTQSTDLGLTQTLLRDFRYTDGSYGNYAMKAVDDQRLLLVRSTNRYQNGNYVYVTEFQRSLDGGKTWDVPAMQGLPAAGYNPNANFVYASPSGTLFMNWDSYLYRSADMGSSWTRVGSPFDYYYYSSTSFMSLENKTLFAVSSSAGSAYVSTDEGLTWKAITNPTGLSSGYYYLTSAYAVDAQTLQVGLSDGSIYRTADQGKTWTQVLKPTTVSDNSQLRTFWAVDAKRLLGINGKGEMLESKDGGLSWQVKLSGLYNSYGPQLMFNSAKLGWLTLGDGKIYRTTDGGETWSTGLGSSLYLAGLHFVNESTGWGTANGKLMHSTDGGLSWTEGPALPANTQQVRFFDASRGIAVGYYGLHETRDGGKTWVARYTGSTSNFSSVSYADASNVWAVGNYGEGILQSTDGGETWRKAALPGILYQATIHFLDAKRGWIVGGNGSIFATVDGGKTWEIQPSGTGRQLTKVQFVDSKTGWVMGDDGSIMATGTGGK